MAHGDSRVVTELKKLVALATPPVLVALAPGSIVVGTDTTEILPSVSFNRAIVLSQVGNQEIYLAIDFPAVVDEGFILRSGANLALTIPAGDTLNAIAGGGGGSIAFQDFAEA